MENKSAEEAADEAQHGQSGSSSEDMSPSHVRPYDCYFCKRGFSTAQALGGHMNIHRKDRAKQKKQSSANHVGSSPTYLPPAISFPHGATLKIKESHSTSTYNGGESEASRIMRWSWSCLRGDDPDCQEVGGMEGLRQLPLFVDWPRGDVVHGGKPPLKSELLTSVPIEEELDLELRLGPCGGAVRKQRRLCMGVEGVHHP